jgi:hypothetical protein
VTEGSADSREQSACSRAPLPTMRTLMYRAIWKGL